MPRHPEDDPVLHRTDRTLIRRVAVPHGTDTMIRKQALGPFALDRTRHERAVLSRLAGVRGVPQVLPGGADDTIFMDDVGGRPLSAVTRPGRLALEPPAVARLALRLARVIGSIHETGVIHRDLHPANIHLLETSDRGLDARIVDFDLATTFAQVRPSFIDPRAIAGRLPYLAPEQTGRTGRPVDQRADLYALGATLYEVMTGAPPFSDDDPLQLVRQILSRRPDPPRMTSAAKPSIAEDTLSRIVLRLLEKEPDARYQSAAGLVHDLKRLLATPDVAFPLGGGDFPQRLVAPSRLIARDAELRELEAALSRALDGPRQVVLVSGGPGVGKSALVEQLRPAVAARGGWLVSGKADQYRQNTANDTFSQAMATIGRLLLAEPEAELSRLRVEVPRALGSNAGLMASVVPGFGSLFGIEPEGETHDPGATAARFGQAASAVLREITSAQRPVVLLLDDLQWASPQLLETVDALLSGPDVPGLLIVGAFRDGCIDPAHPLSAMIERWQRLGFAPRHLRLGNLPAADLAALVSEMLRIGDASADQLATVIGERTAGNPYDTVELVNALRRDGVLSLGDQGWLWTTSSIRSYVGSGDVVDLLQSRIAALPTTCRDLLRAMSCLGSEVEVQTLAAASGLPAREALTGVLPALEDGLLTGETSAAGPGTDCLVSVRFRHDRVQQAAHDGLSPDDRAQVRLTLARRLSAVPDHAADAAQQYLEVVDHVTDPDEQRLVVGLFRAVAADVRLINNHVLTERCLTAAGVLHERSGGTADDETFAELDIERHAALYALGRLDDADEIFSRIEKRPADPVELVGPTCVQISSLTNRGRPKDALALGQGLLERLGVPAPVDDLATAALAGYDRIERWLDEVSPDDDLRRPEVADGATRAAAALISRMCPPAYSTDHLRLAWLVGEAQRLWARSGPQAALVPCLGHANACGVGARDTWDLDRRILRHAISAGEARGYEPMTAHTHFLHAGIIAHWYEPLEAVVAEARAAREVLLRGGDLQNACFAFYPSVLGLLDSAETLETVAAETEAALALAARTANEHVTDSMTAFRQFALILQGDVDPRSGLVDVDSQAADGSPIATAYREMLSALAAALFGDADALVRQVESMRGHVGAIAGTYSTAVARLLIGLAAAERLGRDDDRSAEALAELDDCRGALAAHARSAPANFRQLALLLDAERAARTGDQLTALRRYDAALGALETVSRPWQHGLIAERAAAAHRRFGLRRSGRDLLAEARSRYERWGASAKVQALDAVHSGERPETSRSSQSTAVRPTGLDQASVTSDAIDMMAILTASQAIGSQTDPDRLRAVLVDQLQSLTGATTVLLVLPDDETGEWLLQPTGSHPGVVPVEQASRTGLLPLTAFRYVERTLEPLLVGDAGRDDRFARDPYLVGLRRCSLLAVPILSRGAVRAVLLLMNDLGGDAFTLDRLDAVQMIAGQLAVSLDNVHLYRSLEAKVAARTRDLEAARAELERMSMTDALTQVANRRRFDDEWPIQWERAREQNRSIAVLMIDIDHFKEYNDQLGHLAGDECIQAVAGALSRNVRSSDLVCRYGGEEFALILPGADLRQAFCVAQRAHAAVRALNMPHPGEDGRVTVSIGVAAHVPDDEHDAQTLLAGADNALYEAKHAGRDQVVALSPDLFEGCGTTLSPR